MGTMSVYTLIPESRLASASPILASLFTWAVRAKPSDLRYSLWMGAEIWDRRQLAVETDTKRWKPEAGINGKKETNELQL